MDDPLKVFLSYAPAERDLAKDLKTRLETEGFEVWFADEELFPGDNWQLKAGRALVKSNAMIVLISPEYMASPWMRNEGLYALGSLQYEQRLIPVLVRPTYDFPGVYRRLGMIKVGGKWDKAVKQILGRLHEAAGATK